MMFTVKPTIIAWTHRWHKAAIPGMYVSVIGLGDIRDQYAIPDCFDRIIYKVSHFVVDDFGSLVVIR